MRKKGFTLLEIITATSLFFLMMVAVLSSYTGILRFRYIFQVKANILERTYYMMEKINLLLKDYTIDYDEYFNRTRVGCDSWYQDNFAWKVWLNWYCDDFTMYGNSSAYPSISSLHSLYFCSSVASADSVIKTFPGFSTWCLSTWYQSFGQYKYQFYDQKKDSDDDWSLVNDSDDVDLWKWPFAIGDTTWVQELYLISPDKKNRVFIRRALLDSWDFNWDGITWENELWYTLQILKLKWFDAWNGHDFDPTSSSGVYDGKIDTWACDTSQGFVCHWTGVGNDVYSWYHLPQDVNDWWVTLFDKNLTVVNWNIRIYPDKNPDFSWAEESTQISPYFTVFLQTKPYARIWWPRLHDSLPLFGLSLQTTFSLKDNYTTY